jgi:hypothetical protein
MPSSINAATAGAGGVITTADNSGILNLQSSGNTVATVQSSGFSLPASATINAANTFGFENRIINGGMTIDQRNAGASVIPTVNPQYLVDRFAVENSVASKFAYQQNAGSVAPPTGFINYLGATSQSAYSIGASDYFLLQQRIEGLNVADLGWGTANAKTVTLSFWVRSSLTGTFGGNLQNSANNRFYPYSYTISAANTWEQKSITIAGDTTGTWLTTNSTGIMVRWSLGTGSTYLGTSGSWGSTTYLGVTGQTNVVSTNTATWYITGVQLEVGSQATSFDFRDYGTELILCQRYFVNLPPNFEAIAYYSDRLTNGMMFLPVVMRASPTITGGSWTAHIGSAGTYGGTSTTPNYFRQLNASNNWTAGAICTVSSAVFASAEL